MFDAKALILIENTAAGAPMIDIVPEAESIVHVHQEVSDFWWALDVVILCGCLVCAAHERMSAERRASALEAGSGAYTKAWQPAGCSHQLTREPSNNVLSAGKISKDQAFRGFVTVDLTSTTNVERMLTPKLKEFNCGILIILKILALLLATGDIVMVLEQQPLGWWYGQLGKKRGWFPKHCVKLINEENSPTKGVPETSLCSPFPVPDVQRRPQFFGVSTSSFPVSFLSLNSALVRHALMRQSYFANLEPTFILYSATYDNYYSGHPFTTEDGICFLLPQRPSGWSYDERLRTPQNALSVNNEEEAQRPMAGNSKTMNAFKLPLITSSTSSVHNEQSLVRSSAYEGVMAQSMTISRLPTLDRLELMQSADVQSVEEVFESKPETTQFSSNRRPVQIMKSRARIDTNVLVSDSIKQAPAAFFNQVLPTLTAPPSSSISTKLYPCELVGIFVIDNSASHWLGAGSEFLRVGHAVISSFLLGLFDWRITANNLKQSITELSQIFFLVAILPLSVSRSVQFHKMEFKPLLAAHVESMWVLGDSGNSSGPHQI
ncbi:hypothetical protein F5876DRAFT_65061 [Lentinula aff. lateritia]|uniref:Uncharacterized protein n=1 Tax=Lentinula aff. lateritia TaxID=2804960 RepID=A0ACC1U275_9AGAR|nr:hypothetical protein F5876DRAFT_65061 [Lentinula aff. lateritia]